MDAAEIERQRAYSDDLTANLKRIGREPVMLYVCADKTLTYARRGDVKGKIIEVAQPVGTVADTDEAERVIGMIGQAPYSHLFEDGDKSYLDRAAKVAVRGGGPAQRSHYSLPDFQFDNIETVQNVAQTVCAVRDALRMKDRGLGREAMMQAFEDAKRREGHLFTQAKADAYAARQAEALASIAAKGTM